MIEDSLWIIASTVIVIVLLIVFPTQHMLEKQDDFTQIQLMNEVDHFVHDIKVKGQLSQSDLEAFTTRLGRLGQPFKVTLSHDKRSFTPVYDDPLDHASFAGRIAAIYERVTHEDIVAQLYDAANGSDSYFFNQGDYVTLKVESTLTSRADQLRNMMWLTSSDTPSFYIQLSGMIAHEVN